MLNQIKLSFASQKPTGKNRDRTPSPKNARYVQHTDTTTKQKLFAPTSVIKTAITEIQSLLRQQSYHGETGSRGKVVALAKVIQSAAKLNKNEVLQIKALHTEIMANSDENSLTTKVAMGDLGNYMAKTYSKF